MPRTFLDPRLPNGRPVPRELAPDLYTRWSAAERAWADADPDARRVRLEYHLDDLADDPDRRWWFRVWVNARFIPEPLPYLVLADPRREVELRDFAARARAVREAAANRGRSRGSWGTPRAGHGTPLRERALGNEGSPRVA